MNIKFKNNNINRPPNNNSSLTSINQKKEPPERIFYNNENMKKIPDNSFISNNKNKKVYNKNDSDFSMNSSKISYRDKQSINISTHKYDDSKIGDKYNKSNKKSDNNIKISYDKQSNISQNKIKKSQSIDSKNSKNSNYLANNNNNGQKEDSNKNEKNERANKHTSVSVDKYKESEKIVKAKKKYEIEIINKQISISDKPKGLYNLGLSCYMNSLLQCLFYIQELRDYFIKEKNNFKENQPICRALSEVMYGLKYENKEYFEPILFKKEMGTKNSLFSGVRAGDVKDLYFNLIDGIISETIVEKEYQSFSVNYEPTSKLSVFSETYNEMDKDNKINDLFMGYYEIIYKCKKDPSVNVYSFSTDAFILFNLEKISNFWQNNQLKLEDCFEYNFNRRYNTAFFCSKCDATETNTTEDKIYRPPKILVIILDRGKGKSFKGKVSFGIDLDLNDFIDEENYRKKYSSKYKLISVSTHSGTSSSSGHYTACCKIDNGKYYYFSDTYVHEVDKSKLFENEPYLLFYKRER